MFADAFVDRGLCILWGDFALAGDQLIQLDEAGHGPAPSLRLLSVLQADPDQGYG